MTTPDGWIVLGILAGALVAFAWGRLRPEIVAMSVVLALGLSGVATPAAAFAGFGDPVVITIVCLLIVSAALERTGVAALSARLLLRAVGSREVALIVALMTIAGVLSGFMNLVGATAILLPVALALCRQTGTSPSRLLMPLAIAARQGGSLTLIGKASNLIVSGLMVQAGYAPLSFFSFFPVGIAMLAASIIFMATLGRRLLPARMPEGAMPPAGPRRDLLETYRLPERLFRIRVEHGGVLEGKTIAQASLGESFGMTVLAIMRGKSNIWAPGPNELLLPGDILLAGARPEEVERLRRLGPLAVEPEPAQDRSALETNTVGLAEVVIAPRSDLAGKSVKELEFRQRYGLNVLAVWHAGQPRRAWLADVELQHGDALLLQGPHERLRSIGQDPDFVSLDESPPLRTAQVPYALLALGVVILSGATGAVQVSLAAVLAAGIVVIGGCVKVTEAPQVVDWTTVIVVGSLLPLGAALHTTGAASAVAGAVLPLAGDAPFTVLAATCLATFIVGQFVPAIPTTILMAPIALSAATTLGVNPAPFMITVAAATSLTLLTPISHPVSMMVMVPGGYRFGDYARVGAPLALLLGATLLAVVFAVWRF